MLLKLQFGSEAHYITQYGQLSKAQFPLRKKLIFIIDLTKKHIK